MNDAVETKQEQPTEVDASALPDLSCCPSCKFTEEQFNENQRKWGGGARGFESWDNYKPMSYRDRLRGQWIIECQNCGMAVLFVVNKEGESIDCWNELPRAT